MNTFKTHVDVGMQTLQNWYDPIRGLWRSTNWWNAANALWVTIEYSMQCETDIYLNIISRIFKKHRHRNFLNNFYDDEGWWALSWLKAYDLVDNQHYLVMAQIIFADMETGWDDICHGGVWWSKERSYKNAVTNELFFTVAARLYQRAISENERSYYLNWAYRAWEWFANSGMINYQNLVNDGLRDCKNNDGTIWTYNQGILLGGLTEMFRITQDRSYLQVAEAVADAAISTLIDRNGILQDPCEIGSDCGADGPQFKGIFMRNLAILHEESKKEDYKQFILYNARSIVQNNCTRKHEFGLRWSGPVDRVDAARQTSTLDALIAAMVLDNTSLNETRESTDP
jgi:predicted alpha-1,6-mannanase (GH76 family)